MFVRRHFGNDIRLTNFGLIGYIQSSELFLRPVLNYVLFMTEKAKNVWKYEVEPHAGKQAFQISPGPLDFCKA
jgi:hypothetical protein